MASEDPVQSNKRLNSRCVFSVPIRFPMAAWIPGQQLGLVPNGSAETERINVLEIQTGMVPEVKILFVSSGQERWISPNNYFVKTIFSPTPENFYEIYRTLVSVDSPPWVIDSMKIFANSRGFDLPHIGQVNDSTTVDDARDISTEELNVKFMHHLSELKRIALELKMFVSVTIN